MMGGWYSGDVYQNLLFLNPGHRNRWITLLLEGVKTNRLALGARIKVTVATPEGDRDIHATVSTGGSFGASSLQQEIGLGRATGIQAVEVYWPVTGSTQTVSDLSLDGFFRIREGEAAAQTPWSGRPSAWSRRPAEPGQPRLRRSPPNHNTAGRRLVTVRLRLPARRRAAFAKV